VGADIADANLAHWQEHCDRAGLANRPHIKTHRSSAWALRQIELGARFPSPLPLKREDDLSASTDLSLQARPERRGSTSAEKLRPLFSWP